MNGRLLKSGLAALALATLGGSLMAHDDGDRAANVTGSRSGPTWRASRKCRPYRRLPRAASARGSTPRQTRLPGSSATRDSRATCTQAHVHFGQMSVNGGVSFFLCSNLGNGPAGTQVCPVGPAELTGVITADQVVGPGALRRHPQARASSREHSRKSWPRSAMARPTRTSTRASGQAAKSAVSCASQGQMATGPRPERVLAGASLTISTRSCRLRPKIPVPSPPACRFFVDTTPYSRRR